MPAGLADFVHDAAVLHRFVDFIEEYCKEQERSQTYVDASGLFFKYVEKLAAGTKRQLQKEIKRATLFPKRLPVLRSNLLTLKNYLRLLHALIKPATDAHTLSVPTPLVDLASQQLQSVQGMKNSRIVILLTPEFMYFQRPHTEIKDQARIVRSFIPNASFPSKLGFIELPYSQGLSFFTNLAIYHEIGHFVYEELSNPDSLHPLVSTLKSAMISSLTKIFGKSSRDAETLALAMEILESWTQEIFCDLFAIRLIGPAFSFSFVEMLGMLGFLLPQATVKFNPTHPAIACRLAEHVDLLRKDRWWDAIAYVDADQKKLLESLAKEPRSKYAFYLDERTPGPKSLVDAFVDTVLPLVRKVVRYITPQNTAAVARFAKERTSIQDCLRVGVVPHAISSGPLSPVSIINSAFCFYLMALPEVVKRFEGPKAKNDVAVHSLWTKRLEMWTMKAIEDSQIQNRFKAVKGSHAWSFLEKKSKDE